MGDISKHFNRSEFECSCGCGFNTVDVQLIGILESAREFFNKPININSGCRCEEFNKSLSMSSTTSQHMLGRAADITIKDTTPELVQEYFLEKYKDKYGIGRYDNFTHVDSRSWKARWSHRSKG